MLFKLASPIFQPFAMRASNPALLAILSIVFITAFVYFSPLVRSYPQNQKELLTDYGNVNQNDSSANRTTEQNISYSIRMTTGKVYKYQCSRKKKKIKYEDILCMKPPTFLPNYKNPCWYRDDVPYNPRIPRLRCLPYFHIIGSAKCATTDLFTRISKHPQIVKLINGGNTKETMYWSWKRYGRCEIRKCRKMNYTIAFDEFVSRFPSLEISRHTVTKENVSNYHTLITGHGDPMDIWGMYNWKWIPQNDPDLDEPIYTTPHLIKHMNPNIKLIAILREPAERLFSHYLWRHLGMTPSDFHSAVLEATHILNQCLTEHTDRACLFNATLMATLRRFPLHGSIYSVFLEEWMSVFPREQFLFIRTEDYKQNIAGILVKIFQFLDVEPLPLNSLKKLNSSEHINKTKRLKISKEMNRRTKRLLYNFFSKYNAQLANMLNDTKFLWNDVKDW